jgi:type II secretory pathway pseudopilin PulG
MRSKPSRARRAFTIVEAVATMSILVAVGSVVSGLIYTASRSYTDASFAAQLQAELSVAMSRITRELRYIPIDQTSAPLVPKINSVTASSITWSTNSTISLSSGQVQMVLSGATAEVLLQNVTAFTISTFDETNTALGATLSGAGTGPIRRVQVSITISRNGATQSLTGRTFLRGLMAGS